MAIIEEGTLPKTSDEYISEIYELIGVEFPLEITVSPDGKLLKILAETEWSIGTTDAVTTNHEDGTVSTEYKENYTEKKLTEAQIKKLNIWIEQNIGA